MDSRIICIPEHSVGYVILAFIMLVLGGTIGSAFQTQTNISDDQIKAEIKRHYRGMYRDRIGSAVQLLKRTSDSDSETSTM
jgi:hypothetical protein